jgi:hypothetical protein
MSGRKAFGIEIKSDYWFQGRGDGREGAYKLVDEGRAGHVLSVEEPFPVDFDQVALTENWVDLSARPPRRLTPTPGDNRQPGAGRSGSLEAGMKGRPTRRWASQGDCAVLANEMARHLGANEAPGACRD